MPLHPARDFSDDGASFRVRRARQLAGMIIDVPARDRGISRWAVWLLRIPAIALLLLFLGVVAGAVAVAVATIAT